MTKQERKADMREIIFRAKILRAGKWSKWIYGSMDCSKYTYRECKIVSKDDAAQCWRTVDRNTVGQYINLHDKKRKRNIRTET